MPKPYSTDLRERAVEAVESGASRREVAEMFKLGVSSVIPCCLRWSETGSAEPKRSGGSVSPLEEHSDWILALITKQSDLTLDEILAEPIEAGLRDRAREFLQAMLEAETRRGAQRYVRRAKRSTGGSEAPAGVTGHRHGHRSRTLLGTFGQLKMDVPRARWIRRTARQRSGRARRCGPISAVR
jgi:transposase